LPNSAGSFSNNARGNAKPRPVFASLFLILLVALIIAPGCGYHVVGHNSTLPSGWKTIAVPVFINRTSYYRIEQLFTQATVRELEERTKYRVIQNPDEADGVMHGEITRIEAVPLLFNGQTTQTTTVLVTIYAKISLVDRASQKTLYHNDNVVLRDEYQLSGDVKHFFEEEGPAVQRMAGAFASRVVADMLENF
jgi:hypothetical protein